MAESKTVIANMALGYLGIGIEIDDLETEKSAEARAVRRYYDTALKGTLRDYDWPFARVREDLTLVEEDPNDDWGFSYRYPTDAVALRRIPSGAQFDDRQSRINFIEQYDSELGTIILTDEEDAEMIYTVFHEATEYYPSDFELAFALRLAFLAAPQLCGNESRGLQKDIWDKYQIQLGRARAAAGNEEQVAEDPDSEFIRARTS